MFSCFSLVVDGQIDTLNLFFLFLFGKYEVSFAAFEEIYFIGGKPWGYCEGSDFENLWDWGNSDQKFAKNNCYW